MSEVKVKPIHDQSGPGISGEQLTEEQIDTLRETHSLMILLLDNGANHDAVKQLEKVIEIKWGTECLREVQRRTDAPEREDEDAELPDQNAKDTKIVQPGGFQGMSLEQSLDHLVRKGKASLAEVTRLSLEPDRSKAAFIHARAPVPVNTYPDGREAQAAEAKRIADWAMGGAKP